ncbi:MAG: hypothetical protein JSS97_21585 [Actinobacteria bacterium]|nr:hypothetical protein [Actinomycetota bacterium]
MGCDTLETIKHILKCPYSKKYREKIPVYILQIINHANGYHKLPKCSNRDGFQSWLAERWKRIEITRLSASSRVDELKWFPRFYEKAKTDGDLIRALTIGTSCARLQQLYFPASQIGHLPKELRGALVEVGVRAVWRREVALEIQAALIWAYRAGWHERCRKYGKLKKEWMQEYNQESQRDNSSADESDMQEDAEQRITPRRQKRLRLIVLSEDDDEPPDEEASTSINSTRRSSRYSLREQPKKRRFSLSDSEEEVMETEDIN